mmetsp:Transcript_9630/g.21401  ORF Transcript_9630/g.21401 Transcript_9630/m.21401 type:complete len:467 (-) Transcript_9630:61-1461(-)
MPVRLMINLCLLLLAAAGVRHEAADRLERLDFEAAGGAANQPEKAASNTALLNRLLDSLKPKDTLYISAKTFWLAGGVRLLNAHDVTLQLDGTLEFREGRSGWPEQQGNVCNLNPLQPKRSLNCVQEAFFIANVSRLTLTSGNQHGGTLNGNGKSWWGYIEYALHGEDRPRLLSIYNATDILVEKWHFVNSAYWTFTALDVARLEVRFCSVSARVDKAPEHNLGNLDAFNTDGFDVSGRDIYIHHSEVWNQDDCFTIQPRDRRGINSQCTENVLIENVNASGLGLTIGAVLPTLFHNCIRNVTFRKAYMFHTFKGIYMKSQNSPEPQASGEISNILYEDIYMERPTQVAIWIGPAQEADSYKACSLLWPVVPFVSCSPPSVAVLWENITLRRVQVHNPIQSPGVIYGNPKRPMKNITFENVVVVNPGHEPWGGSFYYCEGVNGLALNGTTPLPPCFQTSASTLLTT